MADKQDMNEPLDIRNIVADAPAGTRQTILEMLLGDVTCMDCGERLEDKISLETFDVGVIKLEPGNPGSRDEPPEPSYIYFTCMKCYKEQEKARELRKLKELARQRTKNLPKE